MKVINRRGSYQQPLAACQKKAEGKRELPPCTPYREKGRGKKDRRGILVFPSNAPAHARTRARMRTREAQQLDEDLGDDDEELDRKAANDLYFGHRKKILDFFKVQ